MPIILLVKSGRAENPVTKKIEKDVNTIKILLTKHKLRYLGTELPPIEATARMSDYAGPQYVVLEVTESEANTLALNKSGFYLVSDLNPAEIAS